MELAGSCRPPLLLISHRKLWQSSPKLSVDGRWHSYTALVNTEHWVLTDDSVLLTIIRNTALKTRLIHTSHPAAQCWSSVVYCKAERSYTILSSIESDNTSITALDCPHQHSVLLSVVAGVVWLVGLSRTGDGMLVCGGDYREPIAHTPTTNSFITLRFNKNIACVKHQPL